MSVEDSGIAQIRVSLVITEYSDYPEELSERLGVKPTKTWRTGEPRAPGAWVVHKSNGWKLESPGTATAEPFEEQLSTLLAVLEQAAAVLRAVAQDACVRVYARFDDRGTFSGIKLNPAMMEALCRIGATLELDVGSADE